MSDEITVEDSRGNIFEDLGLPDPEWHLARADLAIRLRHLIRGRGMSKKQAVAILGLSSPELDDLMRGRLSGFDIDRLLRLMLALGMDVRIHIAPRAGDKADITVEPVDAF